MRKKRNTHIRVKIDTLAKIRESMPDIDKDSDRIDWLYKTSPFRLDSWMGKKPNAKKRKTR